MFNTTIDKRKYTNEVNIKTACSGLLQQSHPQSFFLRFAKGSKMEDWLFSQEPHLEKGDGYGGYKHDMDVVVLQIMCFGDNNYLCEIVDKNIFKQEKEEL